MRKEILRNIAGIIMFYLLIIGGVIAINTRIEESTNIKNSILINK